MGHDELGRPVIYSCLRNATNRSTEDNRLHMLATFEQVRCRSCPGDGAATRHNCVDVQNAIDTLGCVAVCGITHFCQHQHQGTISSVQHMCRY